MFSSTIFFNCMVSQLLKFVKMKHVFSIPRENNILNLGVLVIAQSMHQVPMVWGHWNAAEQGGGR